MAEYITQNERGMKHISLLRRIFLKKLSGKLSVQFATGELQLLVFRQGHFAGDIRDVTPILKRFLAEAVLKFAWEADKSVDATKQSGWVAPWIALADALRDLDIESQRLVAYNHTFSHLPPMVLKNCPVHRFDFADEENYRLLYQLSLGVSSFAPKLFFTGQLTKDELNQRVRTVLLVFLLGYLRPAPKQENNKKVSVVSRILNRFKTKGDA